MEDGASLLSAVEENNFETALELLRNGADVNSKYQVLKSIIRVHMR